MKKVFEYLLDLLLPRAKTVRNIESLTPEGLRRAVSRPNDNLPDDILALFDYGNPLIRQAVWELKYRGNKKIALLLAECIYEELAEELAERKSLWGFDRPILIPIPLSNKRKRERGWNQCELLATALQNRDSGDFFEVKTDILVKVKDTESQTRKNRAQRLRNLRECFKVQSPEKIAGRNIILLDDVTTTGATFTEAKKTLKQSGARKIIAVAVAH